ncbi:hypothetical protein MKZ38_000551 [Zalerion maritima]|uniref:Uncharacterized protein n=1 Tax=Zalerion maritima TaxID=339359 RepID=A0AAD5RRF9_9PEZI|nr:hypothetical protein MKZ38_000551 [Zalerion maritima]
MLGRCSQKSLRVAWNASHERRKPSNCFQSPSTSLMFGMDGSRSEQTTQGPVKHWPNHEEAPLDPVDRWNMKLTSQPALAWHHCHDVLATGRLGRHQPSASVAHGPLILNVVLILWYWRYSKEATRRHKGWTLANFGRMTFLRHRTYVAAA